ncbi:hypothetical protein K432DRAFT_321561 [Lepidopterella palustris CBS 459.81]|uniref:RING-type E3 ubiquitin transferase n=1 Tax=Lepidopterella palustris CBS 459.81 TaxID=1314670 RepID=A0A8E2EHQ1_9PEZI|nr:hypothetical protein K432DRAFT_321561 [Lepidopterella palustris CBS 459.81]
MRPLRLLLSLSSSVIAITILLYISFGSQRHEAAPNTSKTEKKGKLRALFSWTSPSSLFPPSAIISLTDDNSTFFLARPAAFGPLLPTRGLSGQLWIGSGFGDDTMGRGGMAAGAEGELGCSDVPGWSDGGQNSASSVELGLDPKRKSVGTSAPKDEQPKDKASRRLRRGDGADGHDASKEGGDDGTDDYLHHPLPSSEMPKGHGLGRGRKASEHADIQSIQEGAEIAGKIVLLSRGGCGFLEKVKWTQRRGGVALIVGDDVRGGALIRMYAHGDTSNITVPALFTSHTTAHLLSSLIPSGGFLEDVSLEDAAKLGFNNGGKGSNGDNSNGNSGDKDKDADRPTFTRTAVKAAQTSKNRGGKRPLSKPSAKKNGEKSERVGWFRTILAALGIGNSGRSSPGGDSRRPPSSGNIDWVLVEDWNDDQPTKKATKSHPTSKLTKAHKPTSTKAPDDFVIGVQDWRDPDLLPPQTTSNSRPNSPNSPSQESEDGTLKGGSILPGSGEYEKQGKGPSDGAHSGHAHGEDHDKDGKGWLRSLLGDDSDEENSKPVSSKRTDPGNHLSPHTKSSNLSDHPKDDGEDLDDPENHEGLWVTLTPTNMSSSPFFDTLLVLVVSPLVTLTVVYALLLLRSRIRRRRWRAPKSVVERLPVRTYHTISSGTDSGPSPVATPVASSPTTPLLQHSRSRSTLSRSRPRSRTTSEVPATSSSFHQRRQRSSSPEHEKREAGLAEWRRRYGGRQKECVVCLEEYVDGVSRVMSLPCGHEFHAECITPWLVTRRRTCPICKGDVVRSLTRAHHARGRDSSASPSRNNNRLSPYRDDPDLDVQAQAAESRNDSPSAAFPVPAPSASAQAAEYDEFDADVEAGWGDDESEDEERGRERARNESRERTGETVSSSLREFGTTIWRGFESLRGARVGIQRRTGSGSVDRDR